MRTRSTTVLIDAIVRKRFVPLLKCFKSNPIRLQVTAHQVSAWFAQARQLQRLQSLQAHNHQQAVADSRLRCLFTRLRELVRLLCSAQSPVPASTSTEPTGNNSGKTSRQGGFSLDNLLQAKEQQLKMLMDKRRANEEAESDQEEDELKGNAPSSTLLSPGKRLSFKRCQQINKFNRRRAEWRRQLT